MLDRIENEAWDIICQAVSMGYDNEALKRIKRLFNISDEDAVDVLNEMKKDYNQQNLASSKLTENIASGQELKGLINEAKLHPEASTKCPECHAVYPVRLASCPACGSKIKKQNDMVKCTTCRKFISNKAEACPHCGNLTGVHVCPRCSSVNTKVISGTNKATSIFLWGAFAANKVVSKFECKDCGHRF